MLFFEVFVEATSMIDRKYKPILTIMNIFIKSEYLPSIKDTKPYKRIAQRAKKKYAIVFAVIVAILFSLVFMMNKEDVPKKSKTQTVTYQEAKKETKLMSDIYNQMGIAIERNNQESLRQLVSAYFVADYYTLSNKEKDEIGGVDYFYSEKKDDFTVYAKSGYYKEANSYIENKTNHQVVVDYKIISNGDSHKALAELEDYSYYDVQIELIFESDNEIFNAREHVVTVTLIEKDQRLSVVALEE